MGELLEMYTDEKTEETWGYLVMPKICDFQTCDKIYLVDGASMNDNDQLLSMAQNYFSTPELSMIVVPSEKQTVESFVELAGDGQRNTAMCQQI